MSEDITIIVMGSKNEGEPWWCRVDNPAAEADKQPEELYYFNAIITQDTEQARAGYYMIKATSAWFETLRAFMDNADGKPFLFEAKRDGKRGATTPSTTGEPTSGDMAKVQMWKIHRQSINEVERELKSRTDAKRKQMEESHPASSPVQPVESTPVAPAKRWGSVNKAQRDRELDAQLQADIESGKILEIVDGLN